MLHLTCPSRFTGRDLLPDLTRGRRRPSPLLAAGALVVLTSVVAVAPARAQAPPSPDSSDRARAERGATLTARYHVRQMENVLERAVQHAADMMRRRLQAVTPDVLALAGTPRAQGYRIEGHGLFFSVEVPRLSESVNWALRLLSQDSDERVLASLQKLAQAEQDPVVRTDLERAMRTVQMQLAAVSRVTGVPPGSATPRRVLGGGGVAAATSEHPAPARPSLEETPLAPPAPVVESAGSGPGSAVEAPAAADPRPAPMTDPSAAYEDEVKHALVDAMLDYAGSLPLGSADWVTVAARDAGYVAFPDAVSDMVTVTLSVRVTDLLDFRAQRLTRDEARTRVVIKEF